MRRRYGKTLLETVVVIGMMAVLMTSGAHLIGLLLRAEGDGLQALTADRSLFRLAETFRDDVHAAAAAQLADEDDGTDRLTLTLSDERRVTYTLPDQRVQRVVRRGGETSHRETFRLPPGSNHLEHSGPERRVTLVHKRRLGRPSESRNGSPSARRTYRIQAVLGRDRRFQSRREPAEQE